MRALLAFPQSGHLSITTTTGKEIMPKELRSFVALMSRWYGPQCRALAEWLESTPACLRMVCNALRGGL